MERNHDDAQQPLFESLEEFCEAYGFSDALREEIRRDLLLTAPRDVDSETLH